MEGRKDGGRENGKQESGVERKGRGGAPEPHGNSEKSERRQYGSGQAGFSPSFVSGNWEKEVGVGVGGGTGDRPSGSHNSAGPSAGGPGTGTVEISAVLHKFVSSNE